MKYILKFGNQYIKLNIAVNANVITVNSTPAAEPDKGSFTDNLSVLLPPEIRTAGIVVSDKTRLCGYNKYLSWVIDKLEKEGLDKNSIKIYIAYGTHPRQSEAESIRIYGSTYKKYDFIHHNCDDVENMVSLGFTSRGTEVKIRKDILDHDLLILFGVVSHHYFAGYGGGRKLIFPGLAERESIYLNHKLFIDFDNMKLHDECRSGNLSGNPVAEDLYEIDRLMPDKIIITGIPDSNGNIKRLITGKKYNDFLKACSIYDDHYRNKDGIMYDNIIASAGGYPKDINFIQTHKSLHNAASFVRDGGNLFLLAECTDGVGNDEFLNIFKGNSRKDIYNNLRHKYSGNGGTALSLLSKTERINVYMLTELDNNTCRTLGINKLEHEDMLSRTGKLEGSIAIIHNASIVYR
ncbi:MAG TPA: nickel-dependent lactate racemase [Bacteroidales bacterium]|nr:nickel-dependent lactate racemase [Bacteroidales bacterium]